MEPNKTAKEAILSEIQPLMDKQRINGLLSAEELKHLDRLTAALSALEAPEVDSGSGPLLSVFRQIFLLQQEQEASRNELRRIAHLLEWYSQRQRRISMRRRTALGFAGLWLGLSLLLLLLFRWLEVFTVRILCAGSVSGLALAISALQRHLDRDQTDGWPDGEEEDWEDE